MDLRLENAFDQTSYRQLKSPSYDHLRISQTWLLSLGPPKRRYRVIRKMSVDNRKCPCQYQAAKHEKLVNRWLAVHVNPNAGRLPEMDLPRRSDNTHGPLQAPYAPDSGVADLPPSYDEAITLNAADTNGQMRRLAESRLKVASLPPGSPFPGIRYLSMIGRRPVPVVFEGARTMTASQSTLGRSGIFSAA